ncbi:HAD hydrolase-like protein, partial [Lactiplantibacillus pentosus]
MKYQNILFDIDNTLINSADLIAKLLKEGAVREGVDMPIEEYRKRIGQPGEMILREFGVQNWQNVLARYLRTCLDTLTFDLILVKLDQKQEFLI